MAWSRTYLQVHLLTDVIAGALLGSGVSLLVFAIAQLRASSPRGCREQFPSASIIRGIDPNGRRDQP
jgi:membrane-associated phospholipid phosphatase